MRWKREAADLCNEAGVHITGAAGVLCEQQSRPLLGQPCFVKCKWGLLPGLQLLHLCFYLHTTHLLV